MVKIYTLSNPDDGKVMYVGKSVNPEQRFWGHIVESKAGCTSKKAEWIRSLIDKGEYPILKTIDKVPEGEDYRPIEEKWVLHHLEFNKELLNVQYNPLRNANVIRKRDPAKKTTAMSVRLSPEVRVLVEKLSNHFGMSLSGVIEMAIRKTEPHMINTKGLSNAKRTTRTN